MTLGSILLLAGCPSAATPASGLEAPLRALAMDSRVSVESVVGEGVVASDVVVSPDGATLLFSAADADSPYVTNRIAGLDVPTGRVTTYVRVAEGLVHDPAWLPTPGAFLFVQGVDHFHTWTSRIARHDPGAPAGRFTVLRAAMTATKAESLQVAPDGVRVLMETNGSVALARLDSEEITTLAVGTHPTWSPDTRRIAYATSRQGTRASTIFVREDDGRTWPLVESTEVDLSCPAFSPDGTSIAYVRRTRSPEQSEVWLTAASPGGAGSSLVRGTEALGCPAWAPDGTFYVVASSVIAMRGKVLFHVRLPP
jgi:Tol biopolymer transport system component